MNWLLKRICGRKYRRHCFHYDGNRMVQTDLDCPKCFEEMRVYICGRCGAEQLKPRFEYSK